MMSPSVCCLPLSPRLRRGSPWPLRWWHAVRAGWQAARCVLAQQAPVLAPQALQSLAGMDERTAADIGLPPDARAWLAHERVRQADGLWVASRGAVAPSVERSFY